MFVRFDRATSLYAVDPLDRNHDAAMRIGGEAPWWRAHSPPRYETNPSSGLPPPRIINSAP